MYCVRPCAQLIRVHATSILCFVPSESAHLHTLQSLRFQGNLYQIPAETRMIQIKTVFIGARVRSWSLVQSRSCLRLYTSLFMPVYFTSLVASGELCACDVTFHCHYTFADGGIHNLLYTMFLYVAGFVVPVDRDWLCLWEMYKPSYLGQVPRLSSTRLTRSAVSSMASHHCWPYRLLKTPWLWNVVQS